SPQRIRILGFFCSCSAIAFSFHFWFFLITFAVRKYFPFSSSYSRRSHDAVGPEPGSRALIGRFSSIGYIAVSLLHGFDRVPPTISIPIELRSPYRNAVKLSIEIGRASCR